MGSDGDIPIASLIKACGFSPSFFALIHCWFTAHLLLLVFHNQVNFLFKAAEIFVLDRCAHQHDFATLHTLSLTTLAALDIIIPVCEHLLALEFLLDLFKPGNLI